MAEITFLDQYGTNIVIEIYFVGKWGRKWLIAAHEYIGK
jgi:hypothetical protein